MSLFPTAKPAPKQTGVLQQRWTSPEQTGTSRVKQCQVRNKEHITTATGWHSRLFFCICYVLLQMTVDIPNLAVLAVSVEVSLLFTDLHTPVTSLSTPDSTLMEINCNFCTHLPSFFFCKMKSGSTRLDTRLEQAGEAARRYFCEFIIPHWVIETHEGRVNIPPGSVEFMASPRASLSRTILVLMTSLPKSSSQKRL